MAKTETVNWSMTALRGCVCGRAAQCTWCGLCSSFKADGENCHLQAQNELRARDIASGALSFASPIEQRGVDIPREEAVVVHCEASYHSSSISEEAKVGHLPCVCEHAHRKWTEMAAKKTYSLG